jgi:hypothetical protein
MDESISNPMNGSQIGTNQDRSQVSSPENDAQAPSLQNQQPHAHIRKLRHYVRELRGMLLDTQV